MHTKTKDFFFLYPRAELKNKTFLFPQYLTARYPQKWRNSRNFFFIPLQVEEEAPRFLGAKKTAEFCELAAFKAGRSWQEC